MFPKVPPVVVLLGPAFVWAATAQGSGELIWWPYLVARYGGAFLALLLPAALMQFFVNREISRYTAVSGEGVWHGFLSVSKLIAWPLFGLCFVNFLWFGGYASSGGASVWELVRWPFASDVRLGSLFWAYCLIGVFLTGLVVSKVIYRFIERMMKVITAITLVGLVVAVGLVGSWESAVEFGRFLVNPLALGQGVDWHGFDYSKLVTGLVFAGMGGFLNLMYSYWMKDKGVAFAGYASKITGIAKESPIANLQVSKLQSVPSGQSLLHKMQIQDSKENRKRWKGWERYLTIDSLLAVGINALTIVLTSYLAYVLLWPTGQYPEGWAITVAQSRFFEAAFGLVGRGLFLVVAAAFLADTWVSLADGVARQFADFSFHTLHQKSMRWWYYVSLGFLVVVTVVTIPLAQPDALLVLTGVISVFAFVLYIPLLWYLNYIQVPRERGGWLKPGWVQETMLWVVWALYGVLAGWYLMQIL